MLIIDVDGTLTEGTIYYGDNNLEIKAFNTKDGAIIKPMHILGIETILLTGRASASVQRRAADLNVKAIQGVDNKKPVLINLINEYNVPLEQCAYIGDDLNDYAVMALCGFKACPADAAAEIQSICDYISPYNGGHGAVRDICEKILISDNKYNAFLEIYGIHEELV